MVFQETWELRARFARSLSDMYGQEVPAYTTLVEVSEAVNQDFMRMMGEKGERLGSIGRVTAERHGAIRVGSPKEMNQVAQVFAGFGMYPVGFYDLRDAAKSSVPVVSTAFRPIDKDELAKNPFRVFTSMLAADDPRFFSEDLQTRLQEFIDSRSIFSEELIAMANRASESNGLEAEDADKFIELATAAFELNDEPIDEQWYRELESISAVASDIGGVRYTHINHLTPRVLDIDDLYERMEARGITMIDEIQGPPDWEGPDILLRQTSFRALDEERTFKFADGTIGPGALRVRFGEVEQRGIALTEKGRALYDSMNTQVDELLANSDKTRVELAREVWKEHLPNTEKGLREQGLGYFTYEVSGEAEPGEYDVEQLIDAGLLVAQPIVYEDFLPRSAAGIFQSNLKDEGTRDNEQQGTDYDLAAMSKIVGRDIQEPYQLYQAQEQASLHAAASQLGVTIHPTPAITN
ncbi:2-oxoadipate dioxygenase/decarboxylase family protein [Corynebacterium sp. L4756]|uniref:2-oxoadipate dioxygenase/decarboxylase n=1 Tax=unclassified Corynebacterium TaxID=2624378 RepID=UPI00374D9529